MIELSVKEIATFLSGEVVGNKDVVITGLNRIEYAMPGELTFYSDIKYEKFILNTKASAILVPKDYKVEPTTIQAFILVDEPYNSFVSLLKLIDKDKIEPGSFVHNTAIIDGTAKISPNAYIGPYCVIGKNSNIEDGAILVSRVTLYDNVRIGRKTKIYTNVVCYENTNIGENCIIHAGAVIGSDGFGYIENKDGSFEKIPQLGNVVIDDDVEIGANTTIDRAVVGSTFIGRGSKIDNLVQIAHNVNIGEHTGIAGQVGIAGTTNIGKRNRIAGQVGLAGHIETADDVIITAQSGVSKSLTKSGVYFGAPARDIRKGTRIEAVVRNLPEIYQEFLELKKLVMEKLPK